MSFGGGGGGGVQQSEVRQTTSNLPEWARPYYEDLLTRAGYESSTDYTAYEGQRLADFSPMEREAMARMGEMGVSDSQEMRDAMAMAQQAGQGFDTGIATDAHSGYRAGNIGHAGNFAQQKHQSQYDAESFDPAYQAGQRQQAYEAGALGPGYRAGQREVGFDPMQRESGYRQQQHQSGYEAGQFSDMAQYDPGQREVGFDPGSLKDSDAIGDM